MKDKYSQVRFVLIVTLILNLAVSFLKIVVGAAAGSLALISDGLHSLLDGCSNVTGMVGLYLANQPPDESHPYGHRKFEAMAALVISAVLWFTCIEIARSAWTRFNHGFPEVRAEPIFFAALIISILVNVFVATYESRKGKALNSTILLADAAHTRSDIFASTVAMGSLLASLVGIYWIDTIAAILIAVLIAREAYHILADLAQVFTDAARIDPSAISCEVERVDGVLNCHAVRTHGMRDDVHVDLHIVVDPDLTSKRTYEIETRIGDALRSAFPEVTIVNVRHEPARRDVPNAVSQGS